MAMTDKDSEASLEEGSFGTPEAKALRAMTPPEVAADIVRRADAMPDDDEAAEIARSLDAMSVEDWADFARLIDATEEQILTEGPDGQ
jgi:hypothetical protein